MKEMKKILAMVLVFCIVIGLIPANVIAASSGTDITADNVSKVLSYADQIRQDNIMDDYSKGGLSWDTEGKSDSWRYFNGAMLDALLMVGGEENINYVTEFLIDNTSSEGVPSNYHAGEVDSVPMALGMFELLESSESTRFENAIRYVYEQLENQTVLGAEYGYNYWHKMNSASWATWKFGLDGLYMAGTFLMEYANALDEGKISNDSVNSAEIYEDVYNRFMWVADTMYDETTGLYYHGWNGTAGNGCFWGRGIGWYAVALTDTIEMMPEGEYRDNLISKLEKLFEGMLKYQDADSGMWYNVIDKGASLDKNKLETSVSAMMAYAMMKSYNNGWVSEIYGEAGLKAFNGTVDNKMTGSEGDYQVNDIYQKSGVGTTDAYYTQNSYVSDEAKGTAALIMSATLANTASELLAEEEAEKVLSSIEIVTKPSKTNYFLTEVQEDDFVLDISGMSVVASFANGAEKELSWDEDGVVSDGYSLEYNIQSVGEQEVTVVYTDGEITCEDSFRINVCEKYFTDSSTGVSIELHTPGVTGLSVVENTADETIAAAMENLAEKYVAYDIELTAYTQGDVVTVTIPVPEGWDISRLLGISEEDGQMELIDGIYNEEDNTFSYDVTHFSTKGIAEGSNSVKGKLASETRYVLDKDGIDTGSNNKYIIVGSNKDYALTLSGNTVGQSAVTVNGEEIIISNDASIHEFYFQKQGYYNPYYLLTQDGNNTVYHEGGNLKYGNDDKGHWTVKAEVDGKYQIYDENWGEWYLNYGYVWANNPVEKFAVSSSVRTVRLFKYSGHTDGESVTFTLNEKVLNIQLGANQNLTGKVVVGDTVYHLSDLDAGDIVWSSEDPQCATVTNGVVTGAAEGSTVVKAQLVSVKGQKLLVPVDLEVDVYINDKQVDTTSQAVLTGNSQVNVAVGETPDFSKINLSIKFVGDETNTTININNGLTINDYDVSTAGKYLASITYRGVEYGKVVVVVGDNSNPYDGLTEATEYPEYPEDGAVRINKTAIPSENFDSTGVARVELDVAGVTVGKGIDVVLVVDVSNSMGWTDNWFEGMTDAQISSAKDADKIPKGDADATTDKLDQAMQSAEHFAEILLGDNVEGGNTNNTLSFVTFAGYDADNTGKTSNHIDSVQTVFSKVENKDDAIAVFKDTKFTDYAIKDGGGVTYTLQIGSSDGEPQSGQNRGNTNYDYAFAEATNAVAEMQSKYGDYDSLWRETVVVFMTDGAPSHYNDARGNGNASDRIWGTEETYPAANIDGWLEKIKKPNNYAVKLMEKCDVFHAVGFDLAHGGFTGFSPSAGELEQVLKTIISNEPGEEVHTVMADDGTKLLDFFQDLANAIKLAGEEARVQDVINSDFTLQTSTTVLTSNGSLNLKEPPAITVTSYELVKKTDPEAPEATIGSRTGEETVVETVAFNANGTEAYSNLIGSNKNIMTTNADGSTTIEAFYFTYTKTAEGVETFTWNIGDIGDTEMALAFDVALKGASTGMASEGLYSTNEEAILEYIDINGRYAEQTFPLPAVSWGGVAIGFEFYVVNGEGKPCTRDFTQEIPFNNRVVVSGPEYLNFNKNENGTVTAQINAKEILPLGYTLYDSEASYAITYKLSTDENGNNVLTLSSECSGKSTYEVMKPTDNNGFGYVAFPVTRYPAVNDYSLEKDTVVIDYGKSIQIDVLANDTETATNYKKSIAGFGTYKESYDQKLFFTEYSGNASYTGVFGLFEIISESNTETTKVKYTPTKMIDDIERVFAIVKFDNGKTGSDSDVFYMVNEVEIVPATNIYYETNFADEVFDLYTTSTVENEGWNKVTVTGDSAADNLQDDGTVGKNQTYGYDSSYDDDTYLSNGSSLKVIGQGIKLKDTTMKYTEAKFSFTGTGFDIISRTGADQGAIRVTIYSDKERTTKVKTVTVLNKSESELELYQIPVVSVNDLAYGTYYVTIGVNAAYTNTTYPQLNRGGEFYFDAIRVYDPAKGNVEAEAVYAADGEAAPVITEVRSQLIDAESYGSEIVNDTNKEFVGFSFIDRGQSDEAAIATYETIGPNNEVYLAQNQGIAFEVSSTSDIASIDIGVKSPTGGTAILSGNIANASTGDGNGIEKEIKSGTAQYINLMGNSDTTLETIFANNKAYVVIVNKGDSILSITDIKVAYGNAPGTVSYSTTPALLAYAADVTTEPDYDIKSAEFTSTTCRLLRNMTMIVVTSEDVETLKVLTEWGTDTFAAMTSSVNESGDKVWNVSMRAYILGNRTYTVTGYGADGTAGTSATSSIKIKLF